MAIRRLANIVDRDGVSGRLLGVDAEDVETPMARVRLQRGAHVMVPFAELEHDPDGGYRLRGRWSDFTIYEEGGGASVPVVEERVTVDVRPAPPRTLRIRRRLVSERKLVEVPVWRERIEVDRVPVDRFVDEKPEPRTEGEVLVIPCVEEVLVTRLRVREELRVRIVRERVIHRETVELRRHEIEIDEEQPVPKPEKG